MNGSVLEHRVLTGQGGQLGALGGCCDDSTGDCSLEFEADCLTTFLGAGSDCGACVQPPCVGTPASILENEPDCGHASGGPDTVNGGCTEAIPLFTSLFLGDVACASTAAPSGAPPPDIDWYELVLLEPTRVEFCISAAANLVLGFQDTGGTGDCADTGLVDPMLATTPGGTECMSLDLGAGTWWWTVGPAATGAGLFGAARPAEQPRMSTA